VTQAMRPPPARRPLAPLPRCQDAQSGRGPDRPDGAQPSRAESEQRTQQEQAFISTANKEKNMAVINEAPEAASVFSPMRTGVTVMVAGVATGTVLYVLSVIVAGWA